MSTTDDTTQVVEQETDSQESQNDQQPQGEVTETSGTDWQKEARKWESRAKTDAKALAELKKQMKSLVSPDEVADKEQALVEAQKRADALEASALRYKIALAEGLPQDLAERLVGTTEDELREDAERLRGLLKPQAPAKDARGGQNTAVPPAKPNANDLLRMIAKG